MDWIATGLGCKIDVVKITRCSNTPAVLADCLSKGHFGKFYDVARINNYKLDPDMAWVPRALMKWISNPVEDDDLGKKILEELSNITPIYGF